jgi:hypothetical protein
MEILHIVFVHQCTPVNDVKSQLEQQQQQQQQRELHQHRAIVFQDLV